MHRTITLDIPKDIAAELALGNYERVGGVVRDKSSGQVVTWLRETSPDPSTISRLPSSPSMNLLHMAGSAASILNLGATVAFGVATLRGIGRIERKLDDMDRKLDVMDAKLDELIARAQRIEWSIDVGFARTLQALDVLGHYQEVELMGELNSAANMAWSCQFLEPGSTQRVSRIENALHSASGAKEKVLLHAKSEMEKAIASVQQKRKSSPKFDFDQSTVSALLRVRQAIAACALTSHITAEADDLYSAGAQVLRDHSVLSGMVAEFLSIALAGHKDVYPYLLQPRFADLMPSKVFERFIQCHDPRFASIHELLDQLRSGGLNTDRFRFLAESTTTTTTSYLTIGDILNGISPRAVSSTSESASQSKEQSSSDQQGRVFFGLVSGIDEELDRLQGYGLEYQASTQLVGSIQEYREFLRIDEIPAEPGLAFIRKELVAA